MERCRIRYVKLVRIASMGIVCTSGLRVVIILLVRFVGIRLIMGDAWVGWVGGGSREVRGEGAIGELGSYLRVCMSFEKQINRFSACNVLDVYMYRTYLPSSTRLGG